MNLKCDILVSKFAFSNANLYRYNEAELFVEVDACLRDLRLASCVATGEAAYPGDGDEAAGDGGLGVAMDVSGDAAAAAPPPPPAPLSLAAVLEVERRLQAACVAVRVCLVTHVAREEAELWPLFEKHFTPAEQGRLVGLIIGRTGAEVLQSMLSWQRKALTEEEKAAMLGSMRDASRNTRFASWLETWWSSEENAAGGGSGGANNAQVVGLENDRTRSSGGGGGRGGASGGDAAAAAVDGLGQVQEYLWKQQQQEEEERQRQQREQQRRAAAAAASSSAQDAAAAEAPESTEASAAAKAQAAAVAAAAAADKTGYTPSWDDMFRMNRQQLEEAARALSRDDSLAPERKAYLLQHLLAARWICAQQRRKQQGRLGMGVAGGGGDGDVEGGGGGEGDGGSGGGGGGGGDAGGDVGPVFAPLPAGEEPGAIVATPAPAPSTAAAALALAGTTRAMAYRGDGGGDAGGESGAAAAAGTATTDADALPLLCQPIPPPYLASRAAALVPGCKHYARKARLVAACCGAAHVCRFCHDDVRLYKSNTVSAQVSAYSVCTSGCIQCLHKLNPVDP
jgi:zinc finger-like protein